MTFQEAPALGPRLYVLYNLTQALSSPYTAYLKTILEVKHELMVQMLIDNGAQLSPDNLDQQTIQEVLSADFNPTVQIHLSKDLRGH